MNRWSGPRAMGVLPVSRAVSITASVAMGVACAGFAGCGGGTPPAQTAGGADPSASALPDNGPPPPTAPQSPDVDAGLKAFDAADYATARKDFEAAVKKDPKNFAAYVDLGQTCEKLQDVPGAESAYKGALSVQPDLEQAAAQLSTLYSAEGKVDDAMAIARSSLAKHPGSGPLHAALAIALATHGDQDPAIQEFDAAINANPNDPMLQYTLATYLNQWHVRGASPHLDTALAAAKDDYALIVSIGHEYRMAADFAGCKNALDRAIGIKDGGEARTERALCKVGLKDDPGAMSDLQAAIAADPSYAPGHFYLGGRLAMAKKYKDAAAEYQRVLDLAPNGSLAKPAADRLKMAQDAAADPKAAGKGPPKTPKKK
jgi:tetratricopeptide (TPR) repeat protein